MSAPKPDYADVIRNALRLAEADAYPDDAAEPYREALRALAAGEIVVVRAEDVRAVLKAALNREAESYARLAEAAGVTR